MGITADHSLQTPFTGHKHNDYIKLIYMGARWYLPNTNRFLTPDTIIPDQTNPQSFNRYSYVLNRPLNFTDPTGHWECGMDCDDPISPPPPPSIIEQIQQGYNVYGITFDADDGEEWTEEQKIIVLRAVAAVDRQLRIAGGYSGYRPGHAFRQVYGSYTMLRSSKTEYTDSDGNTHDITYGAETFGWRNTIEFYDPAFNVNPLELDFRNNVVHELGHAFNSEIVTASDGDIDPYDNLTVALSEGGELYDYPRRGGMEDYPWQQSDRNEEGEVFADYFLNWTYNSFLGNDAGIAQYNWMSGQMGGWLP